MATATELPIDSGASATDMANAIFGDGVTVVSATYSGDALSSGIYTDGDAVSGGVTPSDTGVILSTGRVDDFTSGPTTGNNGNGNGGGNGNGNNGNGNGNGGSNNNTNTNTSTNTSTNSSGVNNDSDFNSLAGANTFDASFLEVDFIPTGDVMTMQFVFSSEEYPEFSNSIYNDVVGVWINGTLVPLSIGSGDASVGNINDANNINVYQDNTSDQFNTEMDGFTLTMSLTIPVNTGVINTIKIGVADVGDSNYDSNLLIAGDSVQTTLIADDDSTILMLNNSRTIDVLSNDTGTGTLTVTHINGQAVFAGDTITLPSGDTVTLNADGTFDITADADLDTYNFTYQVADTNGNTDTGIVTVETIPCFVAGTMIRTPTGEQLVETLLPGDLVETRDDGPQPLRWIGQRRVAAVDDFAPIHIKANTFGKHDTLMVSPQHRVMIRDSLAELMFGEPEVLVAAKDLLNDHSVTRQEGGEVEYVHILFDKHQVVFSNGLTTESFLPGPQTTKLFDQKVIDEICALFPELDPQTGHGYSPAARRTLRHFEARLLAVDAA
jgi:plastocyanin